MIRKFLILMLVVMSLTACSSNMGQNTPPEPTKSPEEVKKALSGLIEERDEVEEFSVYYAQTTVENKDNSDVYIYFIRDQENNISDLRFVINYIGQFQVNTNWITINADGQIFKINHAKYVVRKFSSFSYVREIYEDKVYLDSLRMVRAMANADKAIVRIEGLGHYEDIVLNKRQKQAMLNVLRAYKNAGGEDERYNGEL